MMRRELIHKYAYEFNKEMLSFSYFLLVSCITLIGVSLAMLQTYFFDKISFDGLLHVLISVAIIGFGIWLSSGVLLLVLALVLRLYFKIKH